MSSERTRARLRVVLAVAVGGGVLAGLGYGIKSLLGDGGKPPKPGIQTIAVLRPPPPPPPPKPEEKPPEPEMKKEEVKLPDPEPTPEQPSDQPPPSQDLGVDAQGGAGTDGFGLVGKPGGRDITTIPEQTGGGGGSRFAFFATQVQNHLQEELLKQDRLRQSDYRAVVRIWLSARGSVERVELVDGTGNPDTDQILRSALLDIRPLKQPPPADMPQPIRLRLMSRGAG